MGEGVKEVCRAIELAGLTETYVLVLRVVSRQDGLTKNGLTTAFAAGCEAFGMIGRTPSVAATEWASRRLSRLRDLGLVEQPKRGFWRITDEGRKFLVEKKDVA